MLAAAETHFAAALQAALPAAEIVTGPAPSLPVGASVHVLASRLALAPIADDARSPARAFTLHTWPADGVRRRFPLPPGEHELAEVEAPPGRVKVRGDDWRVDAGELVLQRPPPAPTLRALLLGAPARGFVERRRCELALLICARDPADLDALATAALAAVLRASVELPDLESAPGPEVRARLRRPGAELLAVTRRGEPHGAGERARCDIELILRGEAELTVAVGTPDPVDRIAQVLAGEVDVG